MEKCCGLGIGNSNIEAKIPEMRGLLLDKRACKFEKKLLVISGSQSCPLIRLQCVDCLLSLNEG